LTKGGGEVRIKRFAMGQRGYRLENGWLFRFTIMQIFDARGESYHNRGVSVNETIALPPRENPNRPSVSDRIIKRAIEWLRIQQQ
jgi:C-terminal processing protease CtpA/Prc